MQTDCAAGRMKRELLLSQNSPGREKGGSRVVLASIKRQGLTRTTDIPSRLANGGSHSEH